MRTDVQELDFVGALRSCHQTWQYDTHCICLQLQISAKIAGKQERRLKDI